MSIKTEYGYDGMIIDRITAGNLGRKLYYTGHPCHNGHDAPRYVSTAGCLGCLKVKRAKAYDGKRAIFVPCHIPQDATATDIALYQTSAQAAVAALVHTRRNAPNTPGRREAIIGFDLPIGVNGVELDAIRVEFQRYLDTAYFGVDRIYADSEGKQYILAIGKGDTQTRHNVISHDPILGYRVESIGEHPMYWYTHDLKQFDLRIPENGKWYEDVSMWV